MDSHPNLQIVVPQRTAVPFVSQVISRIVAVLPVTDQINCNNASSLFNGTANKCIVKAIAAAPHSCFMLDLQSPVKQLERVVEGHYKGADQSEKISETVECFYEFLLDVVEAHYTGMPDLLALYVNICSKTTGRMQQVFGKICEYHCDTLERFGCLQFESGLISDPWSAGRHDYHVDGLFGCNDIMSWIKRTNLSVLYVPALREPYSSRSFDVYQQSFCVPLVYPAFGHLKQINFFAMPYEIERYMNDFVLLFYGVELVTLPLIDSLDPTKNAGTAYPKLRRLFPRATIITRIISLSVELLPNMYDENGQVLANNYEKNHASLQKVRDVVQRAHQMQSIELDIDIFSGPIELSVRSSLECLMKTMCQRPRTRVELSLLPHCEWKWPVFRGLLRPWQISRFRGTRFCLRLVEDENTVSVTDGFPKCLIKLWLTCSVRDPSSTEHRHFRGMCQKIADYYADASYADSMQRRFRWLFIRYESAVDEADYFVDDEDEYNDGDEGDDQDRDGDEDKYGGANASENVNGGKEDTGIALLCSLGN